MPTAQQPKKKKKEEIKINVTFSVRVENHPLQYIHQAKEKVSLKSMALKSTFRSHEMCLFLRHINILYFKNQKMKYIV